MSDTEWALAAQRAMRPIAFHFVVCPHSPARGALLSREGVPVLTNYDEVDWKGLSQAARAAIEESVPKDVKLYVADDAVDVMDVLNISTETGLQFRGFGTFEARLRASLDMLSMQDMRAGITKMTGHYPSIHVNTPIEGKRPPLGALVVTLKFACATQALDYLDEATEILFGAPAIVGSPTGFAPKPTNGKMPAFLADWLGEQFGVVYGRDCTAVVVTRTFSE